MRRFTRELLRKTFHLLGGLLVVFLYAILHKFFSDRIAILGLTALLLLLLEIEYVRIEHELSLPGHVESLLRRHEKNSLTGALWITASSIIAFAAFDYPIAFLALLFAIFGDLASSIFGMKFGKRKLYAKKSWVGFFAGLFVNVFCGYLILPEQPIVFLSMALVASVVELVTSKLDDNFTVPLFAGFVGQSMVFFLRVLE